MLHHPLFYTLCPMAFVDFNGIAIYAAHYNGIINRTNFFLVAHK